MEPPPPEKVPIDLARLASDPTTQDHALTMGEGEAAARLGSFRLTGHLVLSFDGPGGKLALAEERLVEQSATGDLHLRLLDDPGDGMELVLASGKLAGRGRWGPFVAREANGELDRQRDEVFGALGSLYLLSDRGWKLSPKELTNSAGRACQRFDVDLGPARPPERPPRFTGRLDPDSVDHFAFLFGRALTSASGSLCLDQEAGVPLLANVTVRWIVRADGGSSRVTATLAQKLFDVGRSVVVAAPSPVLPRVRRPRGQAAALERFGFLKLGDGGTLVPTSPMTDGVTDAARQKN